MSSMRLTLSLAAVLAAVCLAAPASAGDQTVTTTTTTPATQQWVPGHFEYDAWGNGTYVAGHWIVVPGTSQTVVTTTTTTTTNAPAPVAQAAPAQQVVYVQQPAPQPQVVYVQQPADVVYVQQPVCAPVYAPVCAEPVNSFSVAIGVGGGYRDRGHGGWRGGPFLPIPVPVPFPFFFHHH